MNSHLNALSNMGIEVSYDAITGDAFVRDTHHRYAFKVDRAELMQSREPHLLILRKMLAMIEPDLPLSEVAYDNNTLMACYVRLKSEKLSNGDFSAIDESGHRVTVTADEAFYWSIVSGMDIRVLIAARMLNAQKPKWHKPRSNRKNQRRKMFYGRVRYPSSKRF